MGRGINKLSDRAVREQKQPGYYGDGGGLWLQVSRTGTKSWVFRYTRQGKTHDLGLGSYLNVGLKMARDKATELRAILGRGDDPKAERWAAKANAASRLTFDQCAERYIAAHKDGWKNPKHADQWESTLKTYASPIIGSLDVAHIDTPHIVRILEPIWTTKNETASRVRGRIERILAWATTRKLRKGDNPAAWRNHLDTLLPKPSAVQKERHHEALPYRAINAFIQELREQPGVAPRALEFTILTAARTGEVIGAEWGEIDLVNNVWTVPAGRMKASKEHAIPLSAHAVGILKEMQAARDADDDCEFIFPGWSGDKGLSNMSMLKLLKNMGHSGLTVHGFRSTFRDWAGEQTHHAREVIEHALAHQLKDKAEAAYQRGTLFERRRVLMADWAVYIETERPIAQAAIAA
ncbi:integrase arm-type DNA-binding domain-containing protein [Ralstonia solanacearum]|uniref:tyrosine-type recombinase/integrase n=1 Tax=Ralstonia solanacearum TaxID=305 RepID=UPI0007C88BB1|nr:site-specific integrase [Ralstonia solanacearum]